MNESAKQKLKEKLEQKLNKTLIIEFDTNKSLIAGFVVKIDDEVIDASYATKFENMRKQLI